jgi:predicted AlkP superfamily phosphohydrolase/phosphomutase
MRALLLGFDSFDPVIFERLAAGGDLPNLQRLAEKNGYSRFQVSAPPQTEVSWTSIATGADPGEHGIFDFVHRNPANYAPYVSILPTKGGALGTQFIPPYTARTLFEEAIDQGFPATALWWPAMFPSRPESGVRVLPGLGTPDIRGQLGVGALYSTDTGSHEKKRKTPTEPLAGISPNFKGILKGPQGGKNGEQAVETEFELRLLDDHRAVLQLKKQTIELRIGQWSPIIDITFKAGFLFQIHAISRAILTSTNPIKLYFLPLQIHPLHALWRYGAPAGFVKETWNAASPFLSLGWPQDTTGLEDGCISDEQFLALCGDIFTAREKILFYHLSNFREGVFASIFDDLDRIQHMFRRRHPEFVEGWYRNLDAFVGRVRQKLDSMGGERPHLLVLSDHGFADFNYKVNVNQKLVELGHLVTKTGQDEKNLAAVDWSRSKAYAVGLNSLYANLAGREGQGSVPVTEIEDITAKLQSELQAWTGPDGRPVFNRVALRHEVFSGQLRSYGPDLVLGYNTGYRASSETGLGRWAEEAIVENHDHWEADHCIDSRLVPGVLFSSKGLEDFPNPSFRDIPAMTVGKYLDHTDTASPVVSGEQDQQTLEERLKGLGYL